MLGTGSLGSNMREAQQLAMVWSLTAALPLMMMAVLLREPHGTVARVMTWLPFSAGPLIMFRASTDLDFLAWWEVVGCVRGPAAVDVDRDPHRRPPLPHRPAQLVAAQARRRFCGRQGCRHRTVVSRQSASAVTVVSRVDSRRRSPRSGHAHRCSTDDD